LGDWRASFIFLQGNEHSIFPSGHAAVMMAILSIFWMFWPRYRLLYVAIMLLLCLVLVVGSWHFISDVLAGAFLGASAGVAVRACWDSLTRRSQAAGLQD
jgi:membrane-associated phospholipid phosphatase